MNCKEFQNSSENKFWSKSTRAESSVVLKVENHNCIKLFYKGTYNNGLINNYFNTRFIITNPTPHNHYYNVISITKKILTKILKRFIHM